MAATALPFDVTRCCGWKYMEQLDCPERDNCLRFTDRTGASVATPFPHAMWLCKTDSFEQRIAKEGA